MLIVVVVHDGFVVKVMAMMVLCSEGGESVMSW